MTAAFTGLIYFAAIFTFAFAMGVARALIVAPRLGPTAAVLLEIPILLAVSWVVARRLLRDRPFALPQRALIGAIAFALTMASEAVLSNIMRGQNVTQWAVTVVTPLGLVGLAAQACFAAMPIFAGRGRLRAATGSSTPPQPS